MHALTVGLVVPAVKAGLPGPGSYVDGAFRCRDFCLRASRVEHGLSPRTASGSFGQCPGLFTARHLFVDEGGFLQCRFITAGPHAAGWSVRCDRR